MPDDIPPFKDPEHPLKDPMDRKIARNLALKVIEETRPDDPDVAFRLEFADELLHRVDKAEEEAT